MPSGGYGPGDAADEEQIRAMFEEARKDNIVRSMLPTLLMTYVAARMQGADPGEAATAAYIEWDV